MSSSSSPSKLEAAFLAWIEAAPINNDVLTFLSDHPEATLEEQLTLLLADQARSWASGRQRRAEEYLQLLPVLKTRPDLVTHLVIEEYGCRERLGEPVSSAEYFQRFPELQAELAGCWSGVGETAHSNRQGDTDGSTLNPPSPASNSYATVISDRSESASDPMPLLIGDYEILSEIASGGMGVVYKARHTKLGRLAALKLIKSGGLADAEQIQRFHEEAKSAAQLDHPAIVPVFEAGEHQGRHFMALAFVDGASLSSRVNESPLESKDAARIMQHVAEAIQYAHEHGVIHRDLKPQNILLTTAGQPRVTDFGLAKHQAGDSSLTVAGNIMGTPSYMPPEQARGDWEHVGPLADVYSLGATLYCLLTGRPPFQAANPRATCEQVIRAEVVSPRVLNSALDRDLETICLKCLEKEPAKRYGSARTLAEDLGRYLRNEPILARPVSRWEHGWRWCKRNPVVAVSLSAAASLLIALSMVSTIAYVRESRLVTEKAQLAEKERGARERAEGLSIQERAAREQAERKAEEAAQTVRFLQEIFQTSDPIGLSGTGFRTDKPEGGELTARELLTNGLLKIHSNEAMNRQPLVRASLLDTLGSVQTSLGAYDVAEPLLKEALQIREQLLASDHEDLAGSYLNMGVWQQHQGRFDEAEKLIRQALKIQQQHFGNDDLRIATTEIALAWTMGHRFDNKTTPERIQEVETLLTDAVEIRRKSLGPKHRDVGIALLGLATVQVAREDARFQGLVKLQEAFSILDSTDSFGSILAEYVASVADRTAERHAEAVRKRRSVLERVRKVLGEDHLFYMLLLGDLAGILKSMGENDEAEKVIRQTFALARKSPFRWHPAYANALLDLGYMVRDRGETAEAKTLFEEALEVSERIKDQGLIDRCRQELSGLSPSR